jgi:tol-pal system protein YbgF
VIRRLLLPAALAVGATGCFATRGDLRVLQGDLQRVAAAQAARDSAHARELGRVLAAIRPVADSLRVASQRLVALEAEVKDGRYATGQQLIQIQELTGQSQRRLAELRAELERRAEEPPPVAPLPPGTMPDTSRAGRGTPGAGDPGVPGPNQLFQQALAQLRQGRAQTARLALTDLLTQHPRSEVAPSALYYLGETYTQEGNDAAADSVFALVVERHPQAPDAPRALYKRAVALEQAGQRPRARQLLQQLVDRYPRSDEADLARDRLRSPR